MFKGKKYVTKGIQDRVPAYVQNMIWFIIETMPVEEKDYLQVFQFIPLEDDNNSKNQKVIHTQEEPPYKNEDEITVNQPITEKIYVIDDGPHCTMLLSEEY